MSHARNAAARGLVVLANLLASGCSTDPAPAEGGQAATLLVSYVGNDPAELAQFEQWLGRKLDAHQVHSGDVDWKDWASSIPWEVDLWRDVDRPIFWSIPLIAEGASLAEAATGAYDERYHQAARELAAASLSRSKVYVRTGWEFNGDWMHWSAIGQADSYVEAYRRFVRAFRAESDKFLFEWTPNVGDHGMDPATAYPGDAYVDVIGMDFYYDLSMDSPDPIAAWEHKVENTYGLQWLEDFANEHNKPSAYPEWGVMTDDAGPYIRRAAEWFTSHGALYQSYWNSNDSFAGKLSDDQYRDAGEAYRAAFGGSDARH